MTERRAVLAARGVRKSFGATVALAGVDLEAGAGEVHAILGENGAGKSTLMGILRGVTRADEGSVTFEGAPYAPKSPREARGVAMVHQELSLCPHLSVAENVMLGREPATFGVIREDELRQKALAALVAAAGPSRAEKIPLGLRASELSLADCQLVEIARALADDECRVLILDEPTSSLGREEVKALFDRVLALRARGLAILYISHFLEEVVLVADYYTVLRDGQVVGSGNVGDVTIPDLVAAMAGRPLSERFARSRRLPSEAVLSCDAVAGRVSPTSATFELRSGEVFGIAGVVGAGRTELLRVLFGLDPLLRGRIVTRGARGPATPAARIAQGFGMLSEDRKGEGLALPMTVGDNLTLSSLPVVVRAAWQRAVSAEWIKTLGLRGGTADSRVENLSGGNQQKVALGRLLQQNAEILLLDQPGRGVDVGAKSEIYALIDRLAASGKAILIVSDDLGELLGTCDRIAVMHRGVLGEAMYTSDWTPETLLAAALGADGGAPS